MKSNGATKNSARRMQSYRNQGNSSSFVIDEPHVRFLIFLVCVFLRNLKGTYWDSRMIRSRLASYSSRAAIRPSRMTSVAGATRSVSTTRRLLTAAYGVAKSTTPSPKKTKQNKMQSLRSRDHFFPSNNAHLRASLLSFSSITA